LALPLVLSPGACPGSLFCLALCLVLCLVLFSRLTFTPYLLLLLFLLLQPDLGAIRRDRFLLSGNQARRDYNRECNRYNIFCNFHGQSSLLPVIPGSIRRKLTDLQFIELIHSKIMQSKMKKG
jgi:hypothetical protein